MSWMYLFPQWALHVPAVSKALAVEGLFLRREDFDCAIDMERSQAGPVADATSISKGICVLNDLEEFTEVVRLLDQALFNGAVPMAGLCHDDERARYTSGIKHRISPGLRGEILLSEDKERLLQELAAALDKGDAAGARARIAVQLDLLEPAIPDQDTEAQTTGLKGVVRALASALVFADADGHDLSGARQVLTLLPPLYLAQELEAGQRLMLCIASLGSGSPESVPMLAAAGFVPTPEEIGTALETMQAPGGGEVEAVWRSLHARRACDGALERAVASGVQP